jgi:hypothetical protein
MWDGEDAEDEKTLVRCLVALTKLNDEARSRTALSLSLSLSLAPSVLVSGEEEEEEQ